MSLGLSPLAARHLSAQSTAVAQTEAPSSQSNTSPAAVSPLDHSVLTPTASAPLGQADAAATAELMAANSILARGNPWTGIQGTGTITYADDPTQYSVTLSNRGLNEFRLDIQVPGGVESTRIVGRAGRIQAANGAVTEIDPDTAIMGIFPFEYVAKAAIPGKNTALLDRGAITANGQSLHRVTLEMSSVLRDQKTKSQKVLPVDLYFDSSTHLLTKSVSSILIPGSRLVPFLSVVTYSDYRSVGASMVPFRFVETLNGQPYRTVQLKSVQMNPTLPETYFQFERSNQ